MNSNVHSHVAFQQATWRLPGACACLLPPAPPTNYTSTNGETKSTATRIAYGVCVSCFLAGPRKHAWPGTMPPGTRIEMQMAWVARTRLNQDCKAKGQSSSHFAQAARVRTRTHGHMTAQVPKLVNKISSPPSVPFQNCQLSSVAVCALQPYPVYKVAHRCESTAEGASPFGLRRMAVSGTTNRASFGAS